MPHTPEQKPAGDVPKNAPSGEQQREFAQSSNRAWLAAGLDEAKQQNEQCNRRRVVQQSLALNQPTQAPRCSQVTKDSDHGSRISGGDDRAKQETNDERHLCKWPQRKPNRSGGNEGRNHRKNQDRRSVFDSSFNVRGDSRFKNEQR